MSEGLSRYYEFDIALSGPRASASQTRLFLSADLARTAAQQGGLFSLANLDSRSTWNSRSNADEISLQYAESYMAVRYLNETYGQLAAKELVVQIARGIGLRNSIKALTGLDLELFESQFEEWLRTWEDPARASITQYIGAIDSVLADLDVILDNRAKDLNSRRPQGRSAITKAGLVNSTEALIQELDSIAPPEGALALHQEVSEYLDRVLVWLTLEFQHAETRDDSKRLAANEMIPEIGARELLMIRSISNLEFVFHLG